MQHQTGRLSNLQPITVVIFMVVAPLAAILTAWWMANIPSSENVAEPTNMASPLQVSAHDEDETSEKKLAARSSRALQIGSWRAGPEFDKFSQMLENSEAFIRLDAHTGIEWYNSETKHWETVGEIDIIHNRLSGVKNKQLVRISTGKAFWSEEAGHIQSIKKHASQLGFETVVVTADHSSALVITDVTSTDRLNGS